MSVYDLLIDKYQNPNNVIQN